MRDSSTSLQYDEPSELSEVRFGLRGLLVVTTAVAVGAGVLGTIYRGLHAEARVTAAWSWGICAAIVIVRLGYCAVTRIRLARSAGNALFIAAPRGTFGGARRPWATVLIGLCWIGLGLYFVGISPLLGDGMNALPIVASSYLISMGMQRAWFECTVQLRVNGVLFGLRFLRWTHVTSREWDGNAVVLQGLDQRHRDVQIEAVPTPKIREKVEWLVGRMTSSRERSELQGKISREGTQQLTSLVPIHARGRVTGRGLAAAAVTYVLFCLIAFGVPGRSGHVSREYVHGVQLGFVAAILKVAYDAWKQKDGGAPLVRLPLKLDWPTLAVAMVVAVSSFYIIGLLLFPPAIIAVPLGMTCGLALSVVAGMLFREKLDLCENGIVLVRWPFLPWERVHVLAWKRAGTSALQLRSGWRRIRARVAPECRDAVDQVLRAKCGVEHDHSVDSAQESLS